MNFKEIKEYLLDNYSSKGFTHVAIDGHENWMLKNPNIEYAYIHLTNKDNKIKLELFNVEVDFNKKSLKDVEIIEDKKLVIQEKDIIKEEKPIEKNPQVESKNQNEFLSQSKIVSNAIPKNNFSLIGIIGMIVIVLLIILISKTPEGPKCSTEDGRTTCHYPDGRITVRY